MTHAGAKHSWEMLGVSELRSSGGGSPNVEILHERAFDELPPGRYQLRAFVRDRWANLYGGDLVELELPDAQHEGLAGPVVLRANAAHLPTSLPLRKGAAGEATRDAAVVTDGALPLSNRSVVSGEPLDFLSWVCPGKSKDSIWNIQRYVSFEEQPLFRFEEASPIRAGDCAALRDRLDTSTMNAGRYIYHVRWRRVPDAEPEHAEVPFVIERR